MIEGYSRRDLLLVISLSLIVLFSHGYSSVAAQSMDNGTITGEVLYEGSLVENATVKLYLLMMDGSLLVDETITDTDGGYVFTGLGEVEYMVKVSFGETTHGKYVALDNYSKIDFDFSGRLKVLVRGIEEENLGGLKIQLKNLFGEVEANSTTGPDGIGYFDSLDIHDAYIPSMEYMKIAYTAIATFNGSTSSEARIDVLECTQSDEDFRVAFQHIIITGEGTELSLREAITVQNSGDLVFNSSWLQGWIPADAYDISHDTMDCCIQFFQGGDYSYDPMVPLFPEDSYSLSLSYKLEASIPNQVLEKRIVYDTNSIYFIIKKTEKMTAEGIKGVELAGMEIFGENEYYFFNGSNLRTGDLIQIKLTTQVSIMERLSSGIGLLESFQIFIPVFLVALFFLYQKRGNSLRRLEEAEDELIEALIDAETDYLDGEINQEELDQAKENAESASFRVLEKKTEELEPDLAALEEASKQRVAEKTMEQLLEDLEEDYITQEAYEVISSKYRQESGLVQE